MPKKQRARDPNGAETHPALESDEAPEQKKPDDLIIEDPLTRTILIMLLAKWKDLPLLEDTYRRVLEDQLYLGEIKLRSRYLIGDYYAGTGEKPAMTFSEMDSARRRRLESAAGRLEAVIPERVKARLIEALDEAARLAIEAEVNAIERRIKAAQAKRKAKFTRHVKEALIKPMTGQEYHLGRPVKMTAAQVEQRSIEIIRTIRARPRGLQKVAVLFYHDLDCSCPDAASVARRIYLKAGADERKKAGDRYAALLDRRGLSYDGLLDTASSDNRIVDGESLASEAAKQISFGEALYERLSEAKDENETGQLRDERKMKK